MPLLTATDPRFMQLADWLGTLHMPRLDLETLRVASSDASFRRYFRLDSVDKSTYIAMDAPPPQEHVGTFIHVAEVFGQAGVSVPKIIAQEVENGFLLLTDLGATTYLQELDQDSAYRLYLEAMDALIAIQLQSRPEVLPEYDRALLLRELKLFPEWYVGKHLSLALTTTQASDLNQVFDALLANILAQPQVFVHRDYHSRNLMVLSTGNPGILDFQDAVYGPITYDAVSLLRDAYIQWDEEIVLDLAIRYWERAKRAGLPVQPDIDSFYRDFEYMGLQRHLKILGIFTRLMHRDGKESYLKDLPPVMSYVRHAANRYKELKPLLRLLDQLENKAPQVGYTF